MSAALTHMARRLHRHLGRYLDRQDEPDKAVPGPQSSMTPHANEKEALATILAGLGHQNPEEPMFMLDVFLSSGRHLAARDFQALLAENGREIGLDRARVSLEFFTAMGLSERHYTEDGQALYEPGGPDRHHDHIICSGCGRNVEFNQPAIDHLIEKIACEEGYCHLQHKLVIYGLCPECRQRRAFGLPLSETAVGEAVTVARLEGDEETVRRLGGLGLRRGARLKVLGEQGGAMIVLLDNARLALGPELSGRIMVRHLGRGLRGEDGRCARRQSIWPFHGGPEALEPQRHAHHHEDA